MQNPSSPQAVILADGLFPTRPALLDALAAAPRVVCCDRAYLRWARFARSRATQAQEVYAVGDFDALGIPAPDGRAQFFHYAGQEDNDLTKAVHFCFSRGWDHLHVLGATGLREDHTLGNISLLGEYLRQRPGSRIAMLSDHGALRALGPGLHSLPSFPGQQVSLFSLTPSKPVTAHGLQYPIQGLRLDNWWKGTLNNALAHTFTVEVDDGALLILFQTHDTKDQELQGKA